VRTSISQLLGNERGTNARSRHRAPAPPGPSRSATATREQVLRFANSASQDHETR
jgi:hypothetical protein